MEYILYIICNVYKHSKDYYDLWFYSIVNFSTSKGETSDTKFNHRKSVTHVAARDHAGCPGWALTYGQEDVQWSCLCQDHTDGSGLHSHLESWYYGARAAAEGHVWLHGPMIHRVWVDIHDTTKSCENDQDLFSHLRISQCLRTMPLLTHIDLGSLRCHLWPWRHLGLEHCVRSCLGP